MRTASFRTQVQLEKNRGGNKGQSWMETSSLWPMRHWERQGLSEVKLMSLSCPKIQKLHRTQVMAYERAEFNFFDGGRPSAASLLFVG